jgi:3-deoxy-D-manno-octulosonate 8-phosphate phosphatase (KDO 8-P phosphatase)
MSLLARARGIRLAVFDVDGVLTGGGLHYAEQGDFMKTFDVRDGMGMRLAREAGIALAIITSRKAGSVRERAADLGVEHVEQGAGDKLAALETLLARLGFAGREAAFLGDDLVDLPAFGACGLAVTVADAPAALKRRAHHVTRARGGRGAAREFCELLLHSRDALAAATAGFLRARR